MNKAFEKWWDENEYAYTCESSDVRPAFEAGQNQAFEKAAQLASDNPDYLTSHINGIPYIAVAIRRLKT
jgi:hypothetical protein